MANPATIEDVEARWGPISDQALRARAETWVGDAWRKVKRIPAVESRLASGDLEAEDVVGVICAMVIRVLKNPQGYRQRSIDDASVTIDTALASGELYLSDSERADLTLQVPLSGMYSIALDVPYWGS